MRRVKVGSVLTMFVLLVSAGRLQAQAGRDVPRDHWAYEYVQSLAAKGLVKGYPPDNNFFGGRTVTRYEMAALVDRVLQRVDELLAKKAEKGEKLPQPPAAAVLDSKQIDEVRRLVDEYKVQLGLMGADLQKVKDELGALKADVAGLKEQVTKQEGEIAVVKEGVQAAIEAIGEKGELIKKVGDSRVESGFGKIKVNGLAQIWAQGEKDAPKRGVTDGFRIRRMEIKLSGNINPKAYWWTMFDPAKNLSLNTTAAGGNITSVTPNQASNILQEVVVGWNLTHGVALEIGQQKVPMSLEGVRSASQLLTVERAIFNTLPTNNGRVGDIRDLGAMLRYTHPLVEGQLAVFNDAGNRQNNTDDNNDKEIMWRLTYKGLRYGTVGGYQEISGGVNGALKTQRQRLGAEAAFSYGPHRVEAEYVRGRDGAPAVNFHGGYLVYAYKFGPLWEGVARGEYWNPNRRLHGADYTSEYDLTLGVNYYLVGHNAKIQFNWVRKNVNGPMGAAGPTFAPFLGLNRNLFLMNFQQSF